MFGVLKGAECSVALLSVALVACSSGANQPGALASSAGQGSAGTSAGGADAGTLNVTDSGAVSGAGGGSGGNGAASNGGATNGGAATGGASGNTGGSGGASGSAGSGGSSGSTLAQCPWGDQMAHSTPYGMATTLRICYLGKRDQYDRFQVTTPAAPAGGGYVVVSFRNVSPDVEVSIRVSPAAEDFAIDSQLEAAAAGADYDTWFGAIPNAEFFFDVSNINSLWSLDALTDFEISATFVPVNDPYEPNDYQGTDAPITVGTSIMAYAFSGYGGNANAFLNGWNDFYKVTLKAGTPTLTVTGIPVKFPLEVSIYSTDYNADPRLFAADSLGAASVSVTPDSPVLAGTYEIVVSPSGADRHPEGAGAVPAVYATQPYTLIVTE
jgi:hypothetical protein